MEILAELLKESAEYGVLEENVRQGATPVNVSGMTESGKAHLAASLCKNCDLAGLYVTDSEYSAKKTAADIAFFYGENVLYYPAKEIEYYTVDAKSNEYINERLKVLERLVNTNENTLTVMSVDALLQFTIDFEAYVSSIMTITSGQELSLIHIYTPLLCSFMRSLCSVHFLQPPNKRKGRRSWDGFAYWIKQLPI